MTRQMSTIAPGRLSYIQDEHIFYLTLCMLGNLLCCRLLTFFKINFLKKVFVEYY